MKDQRIELRLPQQQLEELDNFIAEIDSQYKPSRSDVLRSFIAQGIQGKFTPSGQKEDMFPLAARLSIFFQLCQLQHISANRKPTPLPRLCDSQQYLNPHYFESTVTAEALIRQVYLQRLTWFFELDEESLKSINSGLTGYDVLMLMVSRPGQDHRLVLNDVIRLRNMYLSINSVIEEARYKLRNNNEDEYVSKTLTLLEEYAKDNGVPLTFQGYPDKEVWKRHAEMYSMLDWIEQGNSLYPINAQGFRRDQDYTTKYQTMLQIYNDVSYDQKFDLGALLAMVKDRRLYMS